MAVFDTTPLIWIMICMYLVFRSEEISKNPDAMNLLFKIGKRMHKKYPQYFGNPNDILNTESKPRN